MADKNDGGDKTEKPTPKKLQDARRKGQVSKSRDLSSTVPLLAWLAVVVLGSAYAGRELGALADAALASIGRPFEVAAPALGELAWRTTLWLSALALLPAAALGVLVEFLQAGPVFSAERLKPKAEHLNPVEGIKRMFGLDNLVELAKSLAKCVLLLAIGALVLRGVLADSARLLQAPAGVGAVGTLLLEVTRQALTWTLVAFVLVAALDMAWQRHSFTKKLRMSLRDIKQETKESEGDPQVRQQRRQAHQEWSQRNAQQAARQANVLVVNPTHVAIAIDYDRDTCPVPTISAKGEDHVARAMREAAEEAGVPIVRNVPLARDLLGRGEVGQLVPADLFDVVAEVILWAREVRQAMERGDGPPARPAPGEDLSAYADRPPAASRKPAT
ncbi:type III secretion system export apparatus subunit SctU [Rubrivivax benzoatilyticus]|uniref:Type III secretion system export apparatus subunit SctU n=1 Tax=Rubrivivax benzoatilyticus TaxID=316997 RepID=A0ABX0HP19_9BURK|nr:type III secretion system export apparatus subunit SctU [Rubrivivax benzoatilyticus]EGJ10479.1 Translocation protein in type III secretion [Rubrivivax benzoatilyticus JA2 = ATCC BAA-35]NHK96818.1 type III secretion system export apparatus subunit SctU [Rubrivivax benzoatilyticus]NHL24533.1 type III secretion system export apparatus subunit SctU [Rubrivivax benzoatilyticus]